MDIQSSITLSDKEDINREDLDGQDEQSFISCPDSAKVSDLNILAKCEDIVSRFSIDESVMMTPTIEKGQPGFGTNNNNTARRFSAPTVISDVPIRVLFSSGKRKEIASSNESSVNSNIISRTKSNKPSKTERLRGRGKPVTPITPNPLNHRSPSFSSSCFSFIRDSFLSFCSPS